MFRNIVKNIFGSVYKLHQDALASKFSLDNLDGIVEFFDHPWDESVRSMFKSNFVFAGASIPITQCAVVVAWMHKLQFTDIEVGNRNASFHVSDPGDMISNENAEDLSLRFLFFLFKLQKLEELRKYFIDSRNNPMVCKTFGC